MMKLRFLLVTVAAALAFVPGTSALAQSLPDQPGMGSAEEAVSEAGGDTAAAPAAPDLPGSGVLPPQPAPERALGTGNPTRLPETGSNVIPIAATGFGLIFAGVALLGLRRRLSAPVHP